MEIIRNPLFIAFILGIATYGYLWYNRKKKIEENPKNNVDDVNILYPILVSIISFFVVKQIMKPIEPKTESKIEPKAEPKMVFKLSAPEPVMTGKRIQVNEDISIPKTLPNIMIGLN